MLQDRPPAFVVSLLAGVVAAVLIVLGVLTGSHLIYALSIFAAVASLFAALTWRSQLVAAWRRDHSPPPPDNPF